MTKACTDPAATPSSPAAAPPRIGWWWLGVAGIAGLIVLSLTLALPCTTATRAIDPVTGSARATTRVFFGSLHREIETTALSRWLVDRDAGYEPSWVVVSRRRRNVFGGLVGFTEQPLPAVAGLKSPRPGWASPLAVFVDSASDQEILAFVKAMREATEAQRAEAVAGVFERLRGGGVAR